MEGLSKKEKGLMDMDNSVEIAGGGGERWINGNGKNTIKKEQKERRSSYPLQQHGWNWRALC